MMPSKVTSVLRLQLGICNFLFTTTLSGLPNLPCLSFVFCFTDGGTEVTTYLHTVL
jgi:hypothetical protein